ncbi:MAG: TonB family protein [Melioribacteraceae bacterium]
MILLIFLFTGFGMLAQNGVIKSYYPDRTIKSEHSYVNDILDGQALSYHENGKLKEEKNFSRGILNGWIRSYYSSGILKEEYFVKNGVIDGDKKQYSERGQLLNIISYDNGLAVNRQLFENADAPLLSENNQAKPEPKNEIVKPADVFTKALPIEGITAIQNKIVYPEHAKSFGLEGEVVLLATIDELGNLVNTSVKKGIGLGCDEAAVDAVKKSKFTAATKNGEPFRSEIELALEFRLPKVKEPIAEIKKEEIAKAAEPEKRKFEEHLSVMCEADRCPRPEDDLETIYSRFQIPTVARGLKLRGMIIFEGFVDKLGTLKQTKIIEGIGYGCDQLVENALKQSKFTPATKKGEAVDAKIVLSFPFSYDR